MAATGQGAEINTIQGTGCLGIGDCRFVMGLNCAELGDQTLMFVVQGRLVKDFSGRETIRHSSFRREEVELPGTLHHQGMNHDSGNGLKGQGVKHCTDPFLNDTVVTLSFGNMLMSRR